MKIKLRKSLTGYGSDGPFALFIAISIVIGIINLFWLISAGNLFISWVSVGWYFTRWTVLVLLIDLTYILSFYKIEHYENQTKNEVNNGEGRV